MFNTSDSVPRAGEGAVGKLQRKVKAHIRLVRKHNTRQTSLSARLSNLIEFARYRITDPEGKKEYFSKQGEIHTAYAPFSKYNITAAGRLMKEATEKGKPKPVWQGGQRRWGGRTGEDPLAQAGATKEEGGTAPRGSVESQVQARRPIVIVRGLGEDPTKPDLRAIPQRPGMMVHPVTNVPIMTRIDAPNIPDPSQVVGHEPLYHRERLRPRAILKAKQDIAVIQKRPDIAHLPEAERLEEEKKIRHAVTREYFPEDYDVKAGTQKGWGEFSQKQRKLARERLIREGQLHRNVRAGELRMVRSIIHGRKSLLASARAQPEQITAYVDRLHDLVGARQEQAGKSLSHIESRIQKIAERGYPLVTGAGGLHALPGYVSGRVKPIIEPLSAPETKGTHWTGYPLTDIQASEIARHVGAGMAHQRIPVNAERIRRLKKNLDALRNVATKPGEPALKEYIVRSGELFHGLKPPPPEIKGYPYLKKTGAILGGAGLLAGAAALYAAKRKRDRDRSKNINFGAKWDKALRIAKEAAEEQAANVGKSGRTPAVRMTAAMLYTKKAAKTTSPSVAPKPQVENWATTGKGSQLLDFLEQQKKQKWKIPIPSVVPTKGGWASAGITLWPKGSPPRGWPMAIRLKRVIQWHKQKQLKRAVRALSDVNSLTYQRMHQERAEAARDLSRRLEESEAKRSEKATEHRQEGYRIGRTVERAEQEGFHNAAMEVQRKKLTTEQSRRLNRATAIGAAATVAGIGGGYLIGRQGRKPADPDHQFSAWSRLPGQPNDTEEKGGIGHDIATGAIEGGLAYPASEWAYRKLIGRGAPSTLKKIAVGGAVGGLATGAVGFLVARAGAKARALAAAKRRREQEMKSKLGLIQFRDPDQPPRPPLVTKSRYSHQVTQQDYDRANRHYIQTALLGGALGAAFRKKMRLSRAILTGAGIGAGAQGLVRAYGAEHLGPYGERSWQQKRAEKTLPVVGAGVLAGKLIGKERLKRIFLSVPERPIYFASDVEGYDPNDPLTKWSQKWLYKKNYSTEAHAQKIKKWVGRGARIHRDIAQERAGISPKDARGRPKKREWEKPWVAAAGTILALKGGLWGVNKVRTAIAHAPLESRLGQFKESIQRGNVLRNIPVLGWLAHHYSGVKQDLNRLLYGPNKAAKYKTTVVNPKTKQPYTPKQLSLQEKRAAEAQHMKDIGSGAIKPEAFKIVERKKPPSPFGEEFSSRLREIRLDVTWDDNPLYPEEGKRSVQEVPIKKIVSHQDAVKRHIVEKYKKKPGRNLPTLHKIGRKYYVEDGNHRIVSRLEKGEKTVRARVLEMRARLREIRFAETLRDFAISQRSGKTAVVYAPGAQKRQREELPAWKTKRGQRWLWQGGVAGTALLGGLGALAYGKRAFKIGREFEKANRTIGSTGKGVAYAEGEALVPTGIPGIHIVKRPKGLASAVEEEHGWDPNKFRSRQRLIRFDDQSKQIAAGAGGAGIVVGGLYKGRRAFPGEDLTGRRVIRAHSRFPFMQHEGVGTGPNEITHVVHVPSMGARGIVQKVSRESFSKGKPVYVMGWAKHGAAETAKARVGQQLPYSLLRRNCQLFGDECRGAARLTRSFIPRQLRTAITVGGLSAAGGYGLTKAYGRKHEFAVSDEEGIDWDKVRERAQVAGRHGIKWGGAAAAVGGIGAAALGAPFLPGAASFLKIPGREILRKTQTRLARTPLIRSIVKVPKRDPQLAGKSVHDYIEGSQRVLNKGLHGRLIGRGMQAAIADPGSFVGRQLRGRLGMDDWALKHWSKFRSGHLQALSHWGDEWHDLFQRKSIPHREFAGWGKIVPGTGPGLYKGRLNRYRKGRAATEGEIKDLIENKGFSHIEAFRHVTQKSTNPHVRAYMEDLAKSKADPFSHYPKLAAISPGLVAGGGATAIGGVTAYKHDNQR